ncbi:MAG: hypothetical protein LBH87_03705, partial [Coriobacteriales bacterium]|nr:hypothetical protein [Coriobacteriales bacterium]
GYIQLEENEFGTMISATEKGNEVLAEDLVYLEKAAKFINSFKSVEDLSDSTHTLSLWKKRRSGELIEYANGSEVTELVGTRIQKTARVKE